MTGLSGDRVSPDGDAGDRVTSDGDAGELVTSDGDNRPSRWRGILPSLPTPFTAGDMIDHEALAAVVELAVCHGAAGVVCLGLSGEVETLSAPEREEIVRTVVKSAAGKVPVLAGATAESLRGSASLARAFEVAGASAIVLMPPSRMGLSAGELRDFFTSVAATTDLPVIVQDAPEYLDSALSPEIVAAAAERAPTICGAKLEHGPEELQRWIRALPDGFAVFSGNGGLHLLDSLDVGATGVMPAADLTDVLVEIYRAWAEERPDEANERFARVLAMLAYEMQSMPHSNRCAKYVLRRRGVPLQTMLRAPATPSLEPAAVARLERHLERVLHLQVTV